MLQSDREMAVRGGVTVTHRSGAYAGIWASNLAGWGMFGGANMELDLIGGYRTKLADDAALDIGLSWYMYPGGADETDFAERYAKLTGTGRHRLDRRPHRARLAHRQLLNREMM